MIKKSENKLGGITIDKGWYLEMDKSKVTFIKEVNPNQISTYLSFDELNIFTRERLAEIFNDPSDRSYYTPEQLAKVSIEKLISEKDIGGGLYESPNGRILELECDSDYFELAIKWFINLDTKEGFID